MKSKKLWKKIIKDSTPGTATLHPSFFKVLNKKDLVLEIGSGSGRVIDMCLDNQLKVIGYGINANEVAFLKEKYEFYSK